MNKLSDSADKDFTLDTLKGRNLTEAAKYNKNVRDYLISQNELLQDVERAFANREFKAYLQPKFDIRTNKIVGAESLVRWLHPTRGLILPRDFIPMFEQNMIITRLDEYIWEETCRLMREWIDKGLSVVPVSVNVSRLDIYSLAVSNKFVELTEKYGIDCSLIEIEITESAFTIDENQIIQVVDELRSFGFRVLMDDFGTGYSSLNMLKDINVDVLKIDTRFLESDKDDGNKGKEILESVIRMAKWIGLQTVAEGVETDAQKHFLLDLGCYYAQGFFFSKPISAESFEELIKNPDNVSRADYDDSERTIALSELFTSDFMTENLMSSLLGGFAIYEYDGKGEPLLVKANETYYDITRNYMSDGDMRRSVMESVHPEDRENVLKAFSAARSAGVKGTTVQSRNIIRDTPVWITARLFFLAERGGKALYYSSVSDSTEQVRMNEELKRARRSFETALELIEAIVLEYDIQTDSVSVKTKLHEGREYIRGTFIKDAYSFFSHGIIIRDSSKREFARLCAAVRSSDDPYKCELDLLYTDNVYKRCRVTAKKTSKGGVASTVIAVVESTGEITGRLEN